MIKLFQKPKTKNIAMIREDFEKLFQPFPAPAGAVGVYEEIGRVARGSHAPFIIIIIIIAHLLTTEIENEHNNQSSFEIFLFFIQNV